MYREVSSVKLLRFSVWIVELVSCGVCGLVVSDLASKGDFSGWSFLTVLAKSHLGILTILP